MTPTEYSIAPGIYFTRVRKTDFKKIILLSISAARGTIFEDIRKFYTTLEIQSDMAPSPSALTQQLWKLSPDAFPEVFHRFNANFQCKTLYGFPLLACDSSSFAFRSKWNYDCYVKGNHKYFGVHLVALYDLLTNKYVDAEIQPAQLQNEHAAICLLCKRQTISDFKRLLLVDRGFASYNFFVHAARAGLSYVVRLSKTAVKSIVTGNKHIQELGETFDVTMNLHLVRHQRKREYMHQDEKQFYRFISSKTQFDFLEPLEDGEIDLTVRVVCIKLPDGTCEYLAINLDSKDFPPDKLKEIYRQRWGIETSFRHLKLTLGAEFFHSRKQKRIVQEIWSRMILYNFCMEIANYSDAERKLKNQQKNASMYTP